jgi:hypothetical protein
MNGRNVRRASGQDEDNLGHSPSPGSTGSDLGHFFPDRFSPSTSSNYLGGEAVDNGSDADLNDLRRQRYLSFLLCKTSSTSLL